MSYDAKMSLITGVENVEVKDFTKYLNSVAGNTLNVTVNYPPCRKVYDYKRI